MDNKRLILGAKRFLSDYFGFMITAIHLHGIKQDKAGHFRLIQFAVHAPALDKPAEYMAFWREDLRDWELRRLTE